MHFDVVHAGDPRFPGGTSSALRAELKAASKFGVSCALLPFVGMRGKLVTGFERRTAKLIDDLSITWLTGDHAVTCDVLFAHHPKVFEHMSATAVRLRPKRVVCVAHHPPFDGLWTPQYDFDVVERNLDRLFGAPVLFAPVGPRVRSQFGALAGARPKLLRRDLVDMIDPGEWEKRARAAPLRTAILGRHSRPDALKWPDSREKLLAAYPDAKHLQVRALGGVPAEMASWLGSNWALLPFSDEGVSEFLSQLDFYVYFHSRQWVEAFGIGIAEAMACGLVAILDPSYEALFGEGAVYSDIDDTAAVIDRFISSPKSFTQQSLTARRIATEKFSIDTYPARMSQLYEDLELPLIPALGTVHFHRPAVESPGNRTPKLAPRVGARKRILFVATNGIGLGHITRLMAIAEHMASDVEPVFFTRSAGSALIRDRGHAVDYIPWAAKIGVTDDSWNGAYAQELLAVTESMQISAIVFDGTYPFPGLVRVASARPDLAWVWVRRALWVPGQVLDEALQSCFNMIIEPGEFAHDEDKGPTFAMPGPVVAVAPILLADPRAGLPRDEAAARLGIDPARPTAVIQLGSQRNFDYEELRGLLTTSLIRRGLQVVQIDNPLARPSADEWPGVLRRRSYPLSLCLSAIDLMITNAGYNSFHECIYGGIPTIFVPNEAPEMDHQHLRAAYAHSTGLGLLLRTYDLGRVEDTIDAALSEDFCQELRRRSNRLVYVNGALEAARAIEQLVFSVRANAPLHESIARA